MAATTENLVLIDREDGITTVTLNRPDALNALSSGLRAALVAAFDELQGDPQTEVVILTGAGRAFTAGLDLKELGGEVDDTKGDRAPSSDLDLNRALGTFDRPIIGAINGFAITGGFELALMCDLLIASTEAKFADTHARVGVVPGWGLSQRLPRLIGINRAKELSLTGNFLGAELAYEWGLVNRVVSPEELLPTCRALARDILSTEPVTRGEIKRIMDQGWYATLGEGLTIELDANRRHSAAEVTPERVAARRRSIQERGRGQT
jgi:enoyl-CoA hydratase